MRPFKSAGGRQFGRLLAAEVCASAVVMLGTPCSEVVWRVLATHSIRQFLLHFPSRVTVCHHISTAVSFLTDCKQTSPFKSAGEGGASVQFTTGSRGVRIGSSNAGYTMFQGSAKGTGYPLHLPVSHLLLLPCVTVCHHISTGLYHQFSAGNDLSVWYVPPQQTSEASLDQMGLVSCNQHDYQSGSRAKCSKHLTLLTSPHWLMTNYETSVLPGTSNDMDGHTTHSVPWLWEHRWFSKHQFTSLSTAWCHRHAIKV